MAEENLIAEIYSENNQGPINKQRLKIALKGLGIQAKDVDFSLKPFCTKVLKEMGIKKGFTNDRRNLLKSVWNEVEKEFGRFY